MNVVENNNLIVLNDGSTTFLRSNCSSAIDVSLACDRITRSITWKIHKDTMGSDHFPIEITCNDNPPETSRRPKWRFENADWEGYEQNILSLVNPNHDYNIEELSDIMNSAAIQSIPRTSSRPGRKALHWWCDETKTAVKNRRKALRKLKRTPENDPDRETVQNEYRRLRNECRRVIMEAKSRSWERFLDSINANQSATELWRRVNSLSGRRTHNGITIRQQNTMSREPVFVANVIGEYFEQISSNAAYPNSFLSKQIKDRCMLSDIVIPQDTNNLDFNMPFTLNELLLALDSGKGKSAGPDGISYPLLKRLPLRGKLALLDCFNEIWKCSSLPPTWRHSFVVPIPKKQNNSTNPHDYRPIALTNCTSKIMERMVNRRLTTVLQEKEVLDCRQHGFLKGRGTGSYFATLGQVLDDALNNNLHVDIAALDLSKAYNRVWRPAVLRQLINWGIHGNMGNFIHNFLQNRTFQVIIGNTQSQTFQEETGVPQGSVLAVTLFLISMNSVFTYLPKGVYIFVYADDIVIAVVGKTPKAVRRKLQAAVRSVSRWADSVGFQMAAEKCSITHCCMLRHHPWENPVTINGCEIPFKKEMRILGVTIDRKCNFIPHFNSLKKNTESRIRLVKAISSRHQTGNRRTLINIGRSIVVSKLLYGIEITIRAANTMIQLLSPSYNRMIRLASGLLPSSPTLSTLIESGELPFKHVITIAAASRAVSFIEKTYGDSINVFILDKAANLLRDFANANIPPIAPVQRVGYRRWDQQGPYIDWSIKRLVRAGDPKNKVSAVLNSLLESKYSTHQKIFTDGSRHNDKVGIGVYSSSLSICRRLPDQFSVFAAEAAAIILALKSMNDPTYPTIILSDSASVLSALNNPKQKHAWIQAIETITPPNTVYCWVPGHCGVKGNEEADRLANLGRNSRKWEIDVAGSDIKRFIKKSISESWAIQWDQERDLFTRKIKGEISSWVDINCRKKQKILSRLRVGHTKVTHDHYISSNSKPTCPCCMVPLTVEHILADCQQYEEARSRLKLRTTIRDMLSNNEEDELKLLQFLKDVNLYNKI